MGERATPAAEAQRLYEEAESRTAQAMEGLVGGQGFGELLARMTENVVAVTRIGNDVLDLALRNLRLAGRRDIAGLGRQLARTEDKLERVLQEIELLQGEVRAQAQASGDGQGSRRAGGGAAKRTTGARRGAQ